MRVLEQCVPPKDRAAQVLILLQSWIDEEDSQDQRETGEFLIHVLDEDRLSNRRLFAPELRRKSGDTEIRSHKLYFKPIL